MTEQGRDGRAARRHALEMARRRRGAILEVAVRVEYLLGEVLAQALAASEAAAAVLLEHMMWRVPIEVKLKLLSDVLDAYDLSDTFPFIVPVSPGCSRSETSSPIPLSKRGRSIWMRWVS